MSQRHKSKATESRKRVRDAIINITETVSPASIVDNNIRVWIDEVFDPEFENFNLNKFLADGENDGLGGSLKTGRPKNWVDIVQDRQIVVILQFLLLATGITPTLFHIGKLQRL